MRGWSLIVGVTSALIVASILIMTIGNLNRTSLSPSRHDRYDIKEIMAAPALQICPDLADDLPLAELEACARTLDNQDSLTDRFNKIILPDLDEILSSGYPSFRKLAKVQSPPLHQALTSGRPYVLVVEIPAKYFTKASLATASHVLVYNFFMQARFCIQGDCSYSTDRYRQHVLSFPLFTDEWAAQKQPNLRLTIFARDSDFPAGLVLKDGFYVASNELMRKVRYLTPINHAGTSLMISVGFIAIFLTTLGFALVWSRFFDYAAFCYFSASMALYTFMDSSHLFPGSKVEYLDALVWAHANLFIAALTFALATTRIRSENILLISVVLHIFASTMILLFAPDSEHGYMSWINYVPLLLGLALIAVPPMITFMGAMNCRQVFSYIHDDNSAASDRLDFRRRFTEQVLYSMLLLGFGGIFAWEGLSKLSGTFGSATPGLYGTFAIMFSTFGVLIFHTISAVSRTHFSYNDGSESSRLRLRLSEKKYHHWLKQKRHGLLISIDVKNSSLLNLIVGAKSHIIMKQLLGIVRSSFEGMGYYFMFVKRNGDEWLILLSNRHESLARDLTTAVALLERLRPQLERLLRRHLQECSTHISVMALREYTLDQFSSNDTALSENGSHAIDFISSEANYMMKLMHKPASGCIGVAGHIDLLEAAGLARRAQPTPLQTGLTEDHLRQVFRIGHAKLVRRLFYLEVQPQHVLKSKIPAGELLIK